MIIINNNEYFIAHVGVKGMKWGVRKKEHSSDEIMIKKGSEIHRVIPKSWLEKEKTYSGHAYASFKPEDVKQYKNFAKMFGGGNNYVDMTFKAKHNIISPSEKKRVDEFIKLMDSNPKARDAMIKATRNPILFMPKNRLNKLDDPAQAQKAYNKFSYLLVSQRDLRDPYFKQLEKQGYSMIMDDADINGGLSSAPVIIFDRRKSLSIKEIQDINKQ
ncbi:MAG: hypothetical protein K0S61_137 [Anaerocolumna sp.]|nr:hypothetical protein [Anaerocolumna sp.]